MSIYSDIPPWSFGARCPKGHLVTQWSTLANFQKQLEAGTVKFYCVHCDTAWTPEKEESDRALRYLESKHELPVSS